MVIAGAVSLAGCAALSDSTCAKSQQPAIHDALYFGTARPNGALSAEEWARFTDGVVTPRFPKGFTVSRAFGQWQTTDGNIVRESSYVLEIVHPGDNPSDVAVRAIIDAFKLQFQQEAVLRVRTLACVSFY